MQVLPEQTSYSKLPIICHVSGIGYAGQMKYLH